MDRHVNVGVFVCVLFASVVFVCIVFAIGV